MRKCSAFGLAYGLYFSETIYNSCCTMFTETLIKFQLWFRICFFYTSYVNAWRKTDKLLGNINIFRTSPGQSSLVTPAFGLVQRTPKRKNYKIPIETWTRVQLWTWTFFMEPMSILFSFTFFPSWRLHLELCKNQLFSQRKNTIIFRMSIRQSSFGTH